MPGLPAEASAAIRLPPGQPKRFARPSASSRRISPTMCAGTIAAKLHRARQCPARKTVYATWPSSTLFWRAIAPMVVGRAFAEKRSWLRRKPGRSRQATPGKPSNCRASFTVAGRRSNFTHSATTCFTNAALEGASVCRSMRTLSSRPVRQCPPSSSDQRTSVSWSRPIPAPVHVASGASLRNVRTIKLEQLAIDRHRVLDAHDELDVQRALDLARVLHCSCLENHRQIERVGGEFPV